MGVRSSCMTNVLCGYIAQQYGYTYWGLQNGTDCFAGNDGGLATSQGASPDGCTSFCAGGGGTCGERGANYYV